MSPRRSSPRAGAGQAGGPDAVEMLEDAVHLLRLAPARIHAVYLAGTLPFLLALVAFWADMTASAMAREHAASASLGLALLYVWMKAWQAAFCRKLAARKSGQREPSLGLTGVARLACAQVFVQATGLVLLPAALVAALPFAWTYAFYQSFSVLGTGERTLRVEARDAVEEAARWPRSGHVLVLALALLALVVCVNLALALAILPYMARTLLGIESAATRGGSAFFNTTFLTVVASLTYAVADPVAKAAYVVRCFHGRSVRSGLDLRAAVEDLRDRVARARPGGGRSILAGVVLVTLLPGLSIAHAGARRPAAGPEAEGAAPVILAPAPSALDPHELDRAVRDVLERPEFAWRMPRRPADPAVPRGLVAGLVQDLVGALESAGRAVSRWVRAVVDWVLDLLPAPGMRQRGPGAGDWASVAGGLGYALLALSAALLALLGFRLLRRRRAREAPGAAAPAVPPPDVRDETVTADQLPEEGWLDLARELLARGERRPAVRALYLASLAHLARRQLIVLARHKSNREYVRELERREAGRPELTRPFDEVVRGFERVWYGMHEASETLVAEVRAGLERMRRDDA